MHEGNRRYTMAAVSATVVPSCDRCDTARTV